MQSWIDMYRFNSNPLQSCHCLYTLTVIDSDWSVFTQLVYRYILQVTSIHQSSCSAFAYKDTSQYTGIYFFKIKRSKLIDFYLYRRAFTNGIFRDETQKYKKYLFPTIFCNSLPFKMKWSWILNSVYTGKRPSRV